MKRYFVTWEIGIEAESHEDAARHALAIQRNPNSTATLFDVIEEDKADAERIDLTEIDENENVS